MREISIILKFCGTVNIACFCEIKKYFKHLDSCSESKKTSLKCSHNACKTLLQEKCIFSQHVFSQNKFINLFSMLIIHVIIISDFLIAMESIYLSSESWDFAIWFQFFFKEFNIKIKHGRFYFFKIFNFLGLEQISSQRF